jgi:tetratricopeptide (TPR) repeat protein
MLAVTLINLGAVRRKRGRHDDSLALVSRAKAIYVKSYGAEAAEVAYAEDYLGLLREVQGDLVAALASYRRALALRTKALGATHPSTSNSMVVVAGTLAQLNRCAEARPLLATGMAGLESALGGDAPEIASALAALGRCDLAGGQAAPAVAQLERAIAILERAKAFPIDRGGARWLLAQALWSVGQRAAAVAAARTAEEELSGDGDGARDRAAAHAWLAAHTP